MKKALVVLVALLMAQVPVFAAQRGTPEYEALKAYKKTQKEKKDREKANPSPKAKGFWQREAERSGFAGTGAMFSNAVSNAMPLDKPNSGKNK